MHEGFNSFSSWCFLKEIENMFPLFLLSYTPNANMADHLVGAWNEVHESKASQASVFCFDNAFLQKSCLFVDLVCFFSLCLRVAVFLNATRSDRSVHCLLLREKVDQCNSLRRKKGVHELLRFVRYISS